MRSQNLDAIRLQRMHEFCVNLYGIGGGRDSLVSFVHRLALMLYQILHSFSLAGLFLK